MGTLLEHDVSFHMIGGQGAGIVPRLGIALCRREREINSGNREKSSPLEKMLYF
jgi:hypothetical protein